MPKWVKKDFFNLLIEYLLLESQSEQRKAFELFKLQQLSTIQKVLWLTDFFQIAEAQKILIQQVIMPKLTPDYALIFLQDTLKKLQNSQKVDELWKEFHRHLLSYCSSNIEPIILCQQFNNISNTMVEELIDTYLSSVGSFNTLNSDVAGKVAETLITRLQQKQSKLFVINHDRMKYLKEVSQVSLSARVNSEGQLESQSKKFKVRSNYQFEVQVKANDSSTFTLLLAQLPLPSPASKTQVNNSPQKQSLIKMGEAYLMKAHSGRGSNSLTNSISPKFSMKHIIMNYSKIVRKQRNLSLQAKQSNYYNSGQRNQESSSLLSRSSNKTNSIHTTFMMTRGGETSPKRGRKAELMNSQNIESYLVMVRVNELKDSHQYQLFAVNEQFLKCPITHQIATFPLEFNSTMKISISILKDIRQDFLLAYILKNLEANKQFLNQLNITQFQCILTSLTNINDDQKLNLIDNYIYNSNKEELHQSSITPMSEITLLKLVDFEKVSTQAVLSLLKQSQYLKKSTAFKEKFRDLLKKRNWQEHSLDHLEPPHELQEEHNQTNNSDSKFKIKIMESMPQRLAQSILNSPSNYGQKVLKPLLATKQQIASSQSLRSSPNKAGLIENKSIKNKFSRINIIKIDKSKNKLQNNKKSPLPSQRKVNTLSLKKKSEKALEEIMMKEEELKVDVHGESSLDLSNIFNRINITPIEKNGTLKSPQNDLGSDSKSVHFGNLVQQLSKQTKEKSETQGFSTRVSQQTNRNFRIDLKELGQFLEKEESMLQ